jgi:hypothetical protein
MPHPPVPRRDGEGTYRQDEEHPLIASTGPRLGGSTHGHLLEMHRMLTYVEYVCMAPPRPAETLPAPAETNASCTGRPCEKTLQEHPRSCKASGATLARALARPHGTAQHPGRKNVPSASVSLCGILTDTTAEARGLLSGTTIRGPLNNRGKTHFFRKIMQTNSQNTNTHSHDPAAGAHGPGGPSGPPERSAPTTLGRNSASLEGHSTALTRLRLTREPDAPSGEVPPRSRAGRPLGRSSASLEGWTPPRVRLRLARGLDATSSKVPPRSRAGRPLGRSSASLEAPHGLAAPVPAPPTGAFNVLTPGGAQVKDESAPHL